MQRKSPLHYKELPPELRRHVFNFFSDAADITRAGLVDTESHQFANERLNALKDEREALKQQYQENIFYTFGLPIAIPSDARNEIEMHFFVGEETTRHHKIDNVTTEYNRRIYHSFNCDELQNILLFKTEQKAKEYIQLLRYKTQNEIDQCLVVQIKEEMTQLALTTPAFFKVLYLGDVSKLDAKDELIEIENTPGFEKCGGLEQHIHCQYNITSKENVLPLTGELKVLSTIGKGECIVYGQVNYDYLETSLKIKPKVSETEAPSKRSERCMIM